MVRIENATTIGAFYEELKRWVKFKWRSADYNCEYPTLNQVQARAVKVLDVFVRKNALDFSNTEIAAEFPMLQYEDDAFLATMLRVGMHTSAFGGKDTYFIDILSGNKPLVSFVLNSLSVEDDNPSSPFGTILVVKDVTDLSADPDTTFLALMEDAAQYQYAMFEGDFLSRWESCDEVWRVDHLICPICGESISPYERDGTLHADCPCCSWSSQSYLCRGEFAEMDTILRERKLHSKVESRIAECDELFEKVNDVILQLEEKSRLYGLGKPGEEEYRAAILQVYERVGAIAGKYVPALPAAFEEVKKLWH